MLWQLAGTLVCLYIHALKQQAHLLPVLELRATWLINQQTLCLLRHAVSSSCGFLGIQIPYLQVGFKDSNP